MKSLTKLDISSWCFHLSVLPDFGECMKKLIELAANKTFAITKLPESLGFLIGVRALNLSGHRELVLQKFVSNLTSLTMLDLIDLLTDGSIPEALGGLSSLIALHLDGNDFANLPTGCFFNLFQLLYLYLNNCEGLKSLPKLSPRLIHLEVLGCRSMEPLSSEGMWNIVSSLDHEYGHRTNYEKRVLQQPIQSEYVPAEADFLALMPKCEIPSWFPNRCSIYSHESSTNDDEYESSSALEYELVVGVPPCFGESEWCGLVVCLKIKGESSFGKILISWSCKAPGDHHYVCEEWANEISLIQAYEPRLCLMLLDFNEKTCWQH